MSWLRRLTVALLVLAGLAGVGGGAAGLMVELTRHATHAEAASALREEIASRWRRLPAGQIFKPSVTYTLSDGVAATAHLVGIAPAAPCASAADQVVSRALVREGCVTVLRATYVDDSGTVVSTEGIAVMPSESAANKAVADVPTVTSHHEGLKAVPFPGTVTHLFGDRQRAWFTIIPQGPYVFLSTGGYTTARLGKRNASYPPFGDLHDGVLAIESGALTTAGDPCHQQDIRC